MRLQLIRPRGRARTWATVARWAALACVGSVWASVWGSSTGLAAGPIAGAVSVQGSAFSDGSVTVVAPSVAASLDAGRAGRWTAHSSVDFVSGATRALKTDGVSGATQFTEQREDLVLGWQSAAGVSEVGASLAGSSERDFASMTARLQASREIWARRARLHAALAASAERMWLPGASPDWRSLQAMTAEVGLSHILSPSTVIALSAHGRGHRCDAQVGCQASPYRFVALRWADGGRTTLAERHPASRLRGSAGATVSWTPRLGLALHGQAEVQADTWGVWGHALAATAAADWPDAASHLRLELRWASAGAARFFRPIDDAGPDGAPAYRTGDRRLGGLDVRSVAIEGQRDLTTLGSLGTVAVVGHLLRQWTDYRGFRDALGRDAWAGGLGLELRR